MGAGGTDAVRTFYYELHTRTNKTGIEVAEIQEPNGQAYRRNDEARKESVHSGLD